MTKYILARKRDNEIERKREGGWEGEEGRKVGRERERERGVRGRERERGGGGRGRDGE